MAVYLLGIFLLTQAAYIITCFVAASVYANITDVQTGNTLCSAGFGLERRSYAIDVSTTCSSTHQAAAVSCSARNASLPVHPCHITPTHLETRCCLLYAAPPIPHVLPACRPATQLPPPRGSWLLPGWCRPLCQPPHLLLRPSPPTLRDPGMVRTGVIQWSGPRYSCPCVVFWIGCSSRAGATRRWKHGSVARDHGSHAWVSCREPWVGRSRAAGFGGVERGWGGVKCVAVAAAAAIQAVVCTHARRGREGVGGCAVLPGAQGHAGSIVKICFQQAH